MKEEQNALVEECIEALGADGYHKGKNWKGYDVYIPDYDKPVDIGLPYVVMVKDGEVRYSTDDESLDYLYFLETEDAKEMSAGELKDSLSEKLDE